MNAIAIPCPVCQGSIHAELQTLLKGVSFSCDNPECSASVQLSPQSISQVETAYRGLKNIKEPHKDTL